MTSPKAIRAQKFLADAGICSRRAAEELIKEGGVTINGRVAELGDKLDPERDEIKIEGQRVRRRAPSRVVVAVNKPVGFICSNDDPHNERTVFELLHRELADLRLFCAGRLDKDSEGLVILTNDGDLANKLMHPSSHVVKRYHVSLEKAFPRAKIQRLLRGITFEGERLKVEEAFFIGDRSKTESKEIDVAMHHGKKREIRKLFAALGHDVKRLKRYQIGTYSIKGMQKGASVALTPRLVEKLFKTPPAPAERAPAKKKAESP